MVRGAQVVRDAGEDQRPVGIEARQVARHLVEGARQGLDFNRTGFGQGRGRFSLADVGGSAGQELSEAWHKHSRSA